MFKTFRNKISNAFQAYLKSRLFKSQIELLNIRQKERVDKLRTIFLEEIFNEIPELNGVTIYMNFECNLFPNSKGDLASFDACIQELNLYFKLQPWQSEYNTCLSVGELDLWAEESREWQVYSVSPLTRYSRQVLIPWSQDVNLKFIANQIRAKL